MEMIRGLHTCKPQNTPKVGEIRMFIVIDMGKYTKIKNPDPKRPEDGGKYYILSVAKTDYSDQHGNVSFNLEIDPVSSGGKQEGRSESDNPQPSPAPLFRVPQAGGKTLAPPWPGADDRSARIERQHSQHMALLHIRYTGRQDLTTNQVRELIDWYQRDISRSPDQKSQQPEEINQMDEFGDYREGE